MIDENPLSPNQTDPPKYQLLMELGRGGMGVAHLAVSRGLQGVTKLVVLKMMRKQLVGDAESHRMFLEEARISARLSHPNVVHVYEVIEYNQTPTLVMEYLEGQTLWSILRAPGAKLPLPLQLHILAKVLSGLHAAHELRDYGGRPLNLIHRDVSPHNVCVLFDGQVKVLDFGIAKASTSEVETRAGELKGKIRYMPPEQLIRENQDRRVDIFAVGVMLWEAIMGRRFWGEAPEGDVISSLLAKKLPALDASAPAQLRFICAQALADDPDYRYATAGEFQRDLEDYLLGQPDRASAEDDLAAFMHRHFEGEREAAKRAIEAHVQAAERIAQGIHESDTRIIVPRASSSSGSGTPSRGSGSGSAAASASDTRRLAPKLPAPAFQPARPPFSHTATLPVPRRGGRLLAGVLAGALALALILTGLYAVGYAAKDPPGDALRGQAPGPTPALHCERGFKSCDGQCVSAGRPDLGCGDDICSPCAVANATARCNQANRCDIAVCYQDFDDCDGDPRNGCETNTRTDPDHCRGCGKRCPPLPHAQRGCGDACTIWRCDNGFRDCNGVTSDGCEVAAATDPANCGHCGHACRPGQRCQGGVCR
jgi:serine/threonine protein kinase